MIGIVLTAYGMVSSLDDLEAFYTHIFHGRKPGPDKLAQAEAQYRALGVCDPLASVTRRQAAALERRLSLQLNSPVKAYYMCKHTPPSAEETVTRMAEDGVTKVVCLPLSPLFSKTGTGWYERKLREAIASSGHRMELLTAAHWHLNPDFVRIVADRVRAAAEWLPAAVRGNTAVIFTSHSQPGLPEAHPDYCREFRELAEAVADVSGSSSWRIAYRSGGPAPQVWLKPDVLDVIAEVGEGGAEAVVVCDLLSLTANVEVLQDIGIQGQAAAQALGLEFVRTEFLNDSDDFMKVVSDIVAERIKAAGWS
ncbi:ferrochelatase [Paenibacillus residui]